MKKIILLSCCILFLQAVYAQKNNPVPFNTGGDSNYSYTTPEDVKIQEIDGTQLLSLIGQNNKKLSWVVIYTSGCGGTPYIVKYIKAMQEKYKGDLGIYFLSCNNYKKLDDVQQVIFKNNMQLQPYIINKSYGKYGDERKTGVKLRNEICTECKDDIIGVPYNLVFDKTGKIVFHGYRDYNNSLPSDIITYFMDKQ